MRRRVLILAAFAAAATTACGGGEVTVQAQLQGQTAGAEEGETVALGSLPVRLLPYDRDALFDSLSQAYPEPEPQLPDSLARLQDRVIERQNTWRETESRFVALRDSLRQISNRMNELDPQSADYLVLFQDFNEVEAEANRLQEQSQEAFREFTTLQERLNTQAQEIRAQRRAWADEAFAPVDSIIAARIEETGLEERVDTTSASGVAYFRGVEPGQWWVHARYDRPYDELYWNEPIEVARGEQIVVRLTEENAEVRQKM